MPTPEQIRALMDQHGLKTSDIAILAGVNPVTARRWCKRPGPGYIPMPEDAWVKINAAVAQPHLRPLPTDGPVGSL